MTEDISRRNVLVHGARLCLGSLAASLAGTAIAADAAAKKVCADPGAMDSGQTNMRQSLNYTESSPDRSKTCSVCAFFTAAAEGCGACVIFNGPVNSKGRCDSWSQKG